jgi:hypothetical protein
MMVSRHSEKKHAMPVRTSLLHLQLPIIASLLSQAHNFGLVPDVDGKSRLMCCPYNT